MMEEVRQGRGTVTRACQKGVFRVHKKISLRRLNERKNLCLDPLEGNRGDGKACNSIVNLPKGGKTPLRSLSASKPLREEKQLFISDLNTPLIAMGKKKKKGISAS